MFSEFKTGVPMGIATATESRAEERDVYLPAEMASMAHRSWYLQMVVYRSGVARSG